MQSSLFKLFAKVMLCFKHISNLYKWHFFPGKSITILITREFSVQIQSNS